jgi:hypothetical protein
MSSHGGTQVCLIPKSRLPETAFINRKRRGEGRGRVGEGRKRGGKRRKRG